MSSKFYELSYKRESLTVKLDFGFEIGKSRHRNEYNLYNIEHNFNSLIIRKQSAKAG